MCRGKRHLIRHGACVRRAATPSTREGRNALKEKALKRASRKDEVRRLLCSYQSFDRSLYCNCESVAQADLSCRKRNPCHCEPVRTLAWQSVFFFPQFTFCAHLSEHANLCFG